MKVIYFYHSPIFNSAKILRVLILHDLEHSISMRDFPRISVVTTCFNAAPVIQRTIQSVMEQNYPSLQYLVIDGGSTDGTIDIIKSYRHSIDFFSSEPDSGLFEGLNKGIHQADGDFLLFLHAGDTLFNSETLSLYMKYGQKMDFIFGNPLVVGKDGKEKKWHKKPKNLPKLSVDDFLHGMVVCHQTIMVRRNIIPSYHLQFKIASDIDWVIRTLQQSQNTLYIDEFVCKYYRGGISERFRLRGLLERALILIKHFGLLKTMKAHGLIFKDWATPILFKSLSTKRRFDLLNTR